MGISSWNWRDFSRFLFDRRLCKARSLSPGLEGPVECPGRDRMWILDRIERQWYWEDSCIGSIICVRFFVASVGHSGWPPYQQKCGWNQSRSRFFSSTGKLSLSKRTMAIWPIWPMVTITWISSSMSVSKVQLLTTRWGNAWVQQRLRLGCHRIG